MRWVKRCGLALLCSFLGALAVWAQEFQSFANAPLPEVLWVKSVGDIDAAEDEIDGVSVDDAGNVTISGVFRDQINIDEAVLRSRGEDDSFLARYDRTGRLLWAHQIGGPGQDNTFDLTTDGQGNIYTSGWFSGAVDFGQIQRQSTGTTDMFVAKYSSEGRALWVRAFGGAARDGGNEIAVTASGEIAASLLTHGSVTLGGKPFGGPRTKGGAFVLRLDTNGNMLWVFHADGPQRVRQRAIAISEQGHVYAGYQFRQALALTDTYGRETHLTGAGGFEGAFVHIDPQGHLVRAYPVSSAGRDLVRGIGVGPEGAVYASGSLQSGADIGMRQITLPQGRGWQENGSDFVLKLSGTGAFEWLLAVQPNRQAAGGELIVHGAGVMTSSLLKGASDLLRWDGTRRQPVRLEPIGTAVRGMASYTLSLSPQGEPLFALSPTHHARGSQSAGSVLSRSRNGRYFVHVLRYGGEISVAGQRLITPSRKDSALVLMALD